MTGLMVAIVAMLSFAAAPAGATVYGVDTSAVNTTKMSSAPPEFGAFYSWKLGAQFERIDISWKQVQRKKGTFRWGKADREVSAARSYGMRPELILTDSPKWAHPGYGCKTGHCPPDGKHLPDWAAFTRAVTHRYLLGKVGDPSDDVNAIEVWNSPNTFAWWSRPGGVDPGAYGNLYSYAADAIHKEVDQLAAEHGLTLRTPVLFCGCGPNAFKDDRKNLSLATFLRGFYPAMNIKVVRNYDGLALHAYPSRRDIDVQAPMQDRFGKTIVAGRNARDAWDPIGSARKLWLTEVGMTTSGPEQDRFTPIEQAWGMVLAADTASSMSDVAGFTIYTLLETPYDSAHPLEHGYGILEWDAENRTAILKPAFNYLRCWLSQTIHNTSC